MIPNEYIKEVRARLNSRAEAVCRRILPNGKRVNKGWRCGGLDGSPGESLEVELDGPKVGVFHDRATGDAGDILTLWEKVQNCTFQDALVDAADFLGMLPVEKAKTNPKDLNPNAIVFQEPVATALNQPDPEDGPPSPKTKAQVAGAVDDGPPSAKPQVIDWDTCIVDFKDKHLKQVCKDRGYSPRFVAWLQEQEMIGLYKGCVAFPVHNSKGEVERLHFKTADHWQYFPRGGDTAPLVVGAPIQRAAEVLLFESQWDAFAMLDKLDAHHPENDGKYCAYITRGANSNTDISKLKVTTVTACPQNDPKEKASKSTGRTPAEEWLHKLKTSKQKNTAFRVFETPEQFKDANDWLRDTDAPSCEDLTTAVLGAISPQFKAVVRGFMSFPTYPPPEDVLAGDAWFRYGDIHFLNSGAGMGKSVGIGQLSIAWALGLPYFGIWPSRPLKIIHFCGEDDESTLGQIREGFLANSEAITGRKLTAQDLAPLDSMVRTDFSREFTGDAFLARLEEMLIEEHADVILINPLLSFIGGPIVETVSEFLREGLGPILARHRCATLISHHTCKLNKDSWDNMDFTYSGIGGGEVANVPRSILTLAPTRVKELMVLKASKRTTTGWRDGDGAFMDYAYFQRTDNPTRPAWIPVGHHPGER